MTIELVAVEEIVPVETSVPSVQLVPFTRTSYVPVLLECHLIVEMPEVPRTAGFAGVSTAGIGPELEFTVRLAVFVSPTFPQTFQKMESAGPPIFPSLSFTLIVIAFAPRAAEPSATIFVFWKVAVEVEALHETNVSASVEV